MTITFKKTKRGTTIHAKGKDANDLFNALCAPRPAQTPSPDAQVADGMTGKPSVFVFGAKRCGKTFHAEQIRKALGLKNIQDDFWFAPGKDIPLQGTLFLCEEVPERYRHLSMPFDQAMALVKGGEDLVVAHLERTLSGLRTDEKASPAVVAPVVGLNTYDPNVSWAKHTVEITYQMWEFTTTALVTVTGNCKGESILRSAIGIHAEEIFGKQGDDAELVLRRPTADGYDTLETYPDDDDLEHWLERMCVGLKIVAHVPDLKGGAQ